MDLSSLTTSKVTINTAQQLGMAYLTQVEDASPDGVNNLVQYILARDYVYAHIDRKYYPFGDGVVYPSGRYFPELVALWQAFAQHLGHTIANQIFGWGEYNFSLQGKIWSSSGGISSSAKYLAAFDPSIGEPDEKFKWIPVGLITDLMDNTTDPPPVNDTVSGFTYSDIQAAYYTEPFSMVDLKNALKAIKPAQASAIDQLFASYGY